MSTTMEQPSKIVPERRQWFRVRELWAALAIAVIWLAVLFTAVFAPDIVSNTPGATSTTIPPVVLVVPVAALATWSVAKYGFGRRDDRTG